MSTSSSLELRLPFEAPIHEMEARLTELEIQSQRAGGSSPSGEETADGQALREQIRALRRELVNLRRTIFANLTPWQKVQVSRHPKRPQTRDYLGLIFDGFQELHGDRAAGEDPAMITGFARLDSTKVLLVGQQKGKNLAERTACHFGCAHPEGYRKALLKMRMAEKFKLPIVSLIDTPGAYPGITAEQRGQALAIAENLMAMAGLRTPIVCVVIGEGGSGGALGIGVGDKVAMLEHAYYSVISPEGCASILWKGAEHAPRAAEALKMTAPDLKRLGIIDDIVPEPAGGAHRDPTEAASLLKAYLVKSLRELSALSPDELIEHRYQRFRRIGVFEVESDRVREDSASPAGLEASATSAPASASPTVSLEIRSDRS